MGEVERAARILAAALALLALGCSSGAGSSGGTPGTGGGGGGIPLGPLLSCQAGDLDVSSAANPGLTLVPISVTLATPSLLMNTQVYESAPVAVCVPDDAVSLSLFGDPSDEVIPTSWLGSGIGELVDTTSPDTMSRSVTPELSLPKSPELSVIGGRHVFRLAAETPMISDTRLAIRRGARAAQSYFRVNLVLVAGCGVDSTNADSFVHASQIFDAVYAQAGVEVKGVGVGHIEDASLAVLAASELWRLAKASVASSSQAPILDGAVTLYLVRELLSDEKAGNLLGRSFGVPGVPSIVEKNGVALSVDAHVVNGLVDFAAMWVTAAHEIGHWHGLRHTTERFGVPSDFVLDTPECGASRDVNQNGLVDRAECFGRGAENLMFWYYDLTDPPTELTAGQGFVLNSGLTMVPR